MWFRSYYDLMAIMATAIMAAAPSVTVTILPIQSDSITNVKDAIQFLCLSNGYDVTDNFLCLCNDNDVTDTVNVASVTLTK